MTAALLAAALIAQDFTERGFLETRLAAYPQAAYNDAGRAVGDALLRYEASYKVAPWLKFSGALDARFDSHQQVERVWRLDKQDRGLRRPAFSLRRLGATLHHGRWTAELGRQLIRWGKTDILNPTDRFAPKDFLSVVDSDFLGVTAGRLTWEAASDTLEFVWQPRFTPSRTPLVNQRWTALPQAARDVRIVDLGSRFPGGSQFGARWNHIGKGYEYSLCYFDGWNHLPLFEPQIALEPREVGVRRYYPKLRLYGGDLAVPLAWFTVKSEAAWFTTTTPQADEYVLYVVQLERQVKEWSFVGGYAGEAVTLRTGNPFAFAPDRGFARSFVGRAGYTIDANRSAALETVVRAGGSWLRFEYSQAFGQHWRATAGLAWIHGEATDFLGQYMRNSHATLAIRYSF